jgi:hypothetical protein
MSTTNNLKGHIPKESKILYSEKLKNGLYFYVVFLYSPEYKSQYFVKSSELEINAFITTGKKSLSSNGVIIYERATTFQTIDENNSFPKLEEEFKTNQGFRVWQEDYNYHESFFTTEDKKTIRKKSRTLTWSVNVPKLELVNYLLNNQ